MDVSEGEKLLVKAESKESAVVLDEEDQFEAEIGKLRGRWELASVLNFLNVFEPVFGMKMKISAEEIEMGLIKPNSLLAQLHIGILKGIPPASKKLNGSDEWVTVLCKKLSKWWPWVAEGEIPIMAAKKLYSEEILKYQELKPTDRLLILKALCEIRADQNDTVSYINDSLKEGTQISCFRKDKIGGDGNGTSYWHDGNAICGYRLYKEVATFEPPEKVPANGSLTLPTISFQWETLATNLQEFRKVAADLLSSKVISEVTVGKTIGADAIPVLEKLQRNKEMALKRKQRQQMLSYDFRSSYCPGITRSCRQRRPVSYTFDEYDLAITEAIQLSKRGKTTDEPKQKETHSGHGKIEVVGSSGSSDTERSSEDDSDKKDDSQDADSGNELLSDDKNNDFDNGTKVDGNHVKLHSPRHFDCNFKKPMGVHRSKKLDGNTTHPAIERTNVGAKNRLRQRPTLNSALNYVVVSDTDDEN